MAVALICSAPGCAFATPEAEVALSLQVLQLHASLAHPVQAQPVAQLAARPTTKVEARARPKVTMETSEADWRYFRSEWTDYKSATHIADQALLDELWQCMEGDLKRLAFNQGGKDQLTTEDLMMDRIRSLAVRELHAAVHTVHLHEAKQLAEESVKAFAARVRGIAASANLSKAYTCSAPNCGQQANISFTEETVYHVTLAGLRDSELQERCLSAAYMKTVTNIQQLVQFCSAEESSKQNNPTVGGIGALRASTYKKEKGGLKKQQQGGQQVQQPLPKCRWCGGKPHQGQSMEERRNQCKASQHTCTACQGRGHFESVCLNSKRVRTRRASAAAIEGEAVEGQLNGFHVCSLTSDCPAAAGALPPLAGSCRPGDRRVCLGNPLPPTSTIQHGTREPGQQHESRDAGKPYAGTAYRALPPGGNVPVVLHPSPIVGQSPRQQQDERKDQSLQFSQHPEAGRPGLPADSSIEHYAGTAHRALAPGGLVPINHSFLANHQPLRPLPEYESLAAAVTRMSGAVPLCHMEYRDTGHGWKWEEDIMRPSPLLEVTLELHTTSYLGLDLPLPRFLQGRSSSRPVTASGVADTGAQMDICSPALAQQLGIDTSSLFPVKARVFAASRGASIDIIGGIIVKMSAPGRQTALSTVRLIYVASNVSRTYLSLSTLTDLGVVDEAFPRIGDKIAEVASTSTAQGASLPPCTNSGVPVPGEQQCSCTARTLPPTSKPSLPCPATEENLPKLKQYIMDRYASSTFNVCEHQPLPMMKSSPNLKLHVDPAATPKAVHKPSVVPIHWKEAVHAGLMRDVRLGVLEQVPLNTPVMWQSRMHVTAKHDGSPRRVVDFQALNSVSPRQTHHTQSPWHLVSTIPGGTKKTTFDAFHGYHSLPLATEKDRAATTFVTEWGRFRYITCPQGFLSAGDAYTDRMDRLLEGVENKRRCIDDTLLFDQTIEAAFFRACRFLDISGSNGVVLNPTKFQFAEDEVNFIGFTVSASGVRPTNEFVESILGFPTPTSLTDIRSWFGAVAQISYTFATSTVMAPFKHLLSSKAAFTWSPDLDAAFQASKVEVAKQCAAGVRAFDPALPVALATDWCKTAMGFWLTQKHCSCPQGQPGCCPTGWQTVNVGSRFCTGAESRYSPICGEAAAAAWGAEKNRFFLLGLPNYIHCLDHRPLLKILSPNTELGDITNPRLYNQKVKMLPYRFTPVFVPGKEHVTPDCFSRRSDHNYQAPEPKQTVDLLDIGNVRAEYATSLSAPSWVSQPGVLAAFTAHPISNLEKSQAEDTDMVEALLVAAARSSLLEHHQEEAEVAAMQPSAVRMITWHRLQQAVSSSHLCQELLALLRTGLPEDKVDWPPNLVQYFPHRASLITTDGVIMCGERPLIPADLRPEVLEHLHGAHHGVTRMLSRASQSVFWPGLKADVIAHREGCRACNLHAPSQPAPPPALPIQPDYPFSHVVADFFQVDTTYLAMADRYSGWLSIFKLKTDDSANIMAALRHYFSTWGVPKNITTDGASVFTSLAMKDFYDKWGVDHRVASAYYPRANKRSEVAVKSAKRLVMDNLGPGGSCNTDKLTRALLMHRNNPDPVTGVSPAQVIFGRDLRDHMPGQYSKYQPRREWRLEADLRAKAMAKRHGRMEDRLLIGSRALPPLSVGDTVFIQDQKTNNGKAGRWNKSGEVMEVLPFDSYQVQVHGSRTVTQRNRRFLRKFSPFQPAIPGPPRRLPPAPATTAKPATCIQGPALLPAPPTTASRPAPAPLAAPPAPKARVTAPPTPAPTYRSPAAATHRSLPAGPPGSDIVAKLLRQEKEYQAAAFEDTYFGAAFKDPFRPADRPSTSPSLQG